MVGKVGSMHGGLGLDECVLDWESVQVTAGRLGTDRPALGTEEVEYGAQA